MSYPPIYDPEKKRQKSKWQSIEKWRRENIVALGISTFFFLAGIIIVWCINGECPPAGAIAELFVICYCFTGTVWLITVIAHRNDKR